MFTAGFVRYLLGDSGAMPAAVLTKLDLCDDREEIYGTKNYYQK